jgi:hypothetical protein
MINDHLMVLDDTIKELEDKLREESDPFLESMLERLKIIKSRSLPVMIEKERQDDEFKRVYKMMGSF